jgi:hypothetical protein
VATRFAAYRYVLSGFEPDLSFERLQVVLSTTRPYLVREVQWVIGDVRSDKLDATDIISGRLGVATVSEDVSYDESEHRFLLTEPIARVDRLVNFYVFPETHLIAAELKATIPPAQFASHFANVVSTSPAFPMAQIELLPVIQEFEFLREVQSLDHVSLAVFKLRPSNPNNRELWKPMDEDLRAMHAAEEVRRIKAKKGQSLVVKGTSLERAAAQVEDGYGEGRVIGERDGRKIIVTSKDMPANFEVPDFPSPEAEAQIAQELANLQSRMSRHE